MILGFVTTQPRLRRTTHSSAHLCRHAFNTRPLFATTLTHQSLAWLGLVALQDVLGESLGRLNDDQIVEAGESVEEERSDCEDMT